MSNVRGNDPAWCRYEPANLEYPVVITCSISGSIANREQCPAIPYTPAEYAAEARRIVDEGGVHIHIHARRPDGSPSYEIEDFRAIKDAIVAEIGDAAIINFSTGTVGVPVSKRIAYLEAARPEVAALNMGSMNYAKYSRKRKDFVFKFVFANPFDEIIELLRRCAGCRSSPSTSASTSVTSDRSSRWWTWDCSMRHCMPTSSWAWSAACPPTARNLAAMADNLPAGDHHWGVIGIGRGPVDAGRGGADARRVDPGRPGGQLLSPGRARWRAPTGS